MSAYLYCSTARGIEEHIRDGESCRICKDWIKKHDLKIKDGKVANPPRIITPKAAQRKARKSQSSASPRAQARTAKCGTTGGLRRHYTDKTKTCDPCLEAGREYQRARRIKNGSKVNISATIERVHGSRRGWQQHHRLKEVPCEPCREAKNAYNRAQRAKKRTAQGDAA